MDDKLIDITFQDADLNECLNAFNQLCKTYYPEIKTYDHNDLHSLRTDISPTRWRRFLLNEKIRQWFDEEQELDTRKKISILTAKAENLSQAQNQTLNTLLAQQAKNKQNNNRTIIIYNCVPINSDEKSNDNINELKDIPESIGNAIKTIDIL